MTLRNPETGETIEVEEWKVSSYLIQGWVRVEDPPDGRVREPRRPKPLAPAGAVALEIE